MTVEASARECGGDELVGDVFRVSEVHDLVLCELRMRQDLHESGESDRMDFRDSGNRFGTQDAVVDKTQFADALRHENVAIGQERQAPGVIETARNGGD